MKRSRLTRSEKSALEKAISCSTGADQEPACPMAIPALANSEDELKELLRKGSFRGRHRELATVMGHFGYLARGKGLLYIEHFIPDTADSNLDTLLRLVVNGTDPALVTQVAIHLGKNVSAKFRTYTELLRYGIEMLQSGCNPSQMTEALWAIIGEVPARPPDRPDLAGNADGLLSQKEIDRLLGGRKLRRELRK